MVKKIPHLQVRSQDSWPLTVLQLPTAAPRVSPSAQVHIPYSAVLTPAAALGNYEITYNTAALPSQLRMPPLWLTVKTKLTAKQIPILPEHYQGSWLVTMVTASYSRLPGETVAGGPYAISAVTKPIWGSGKLQRLPIPLPSLQ